MKARDLLIAIWKKNNGVWEDIYEDLKNKVYPNEEEIDTIDNDKYITLLDEEYPLDLKYSYKPPFVLVRK